MAADTKTTRFPALWLRYRACEHRKAAERERAPALRRRRRRVTKTCIRPQALTIRRADPNPMNAPVG